MKEAIITILGHPLTFHYFVHDGGHIEWTVRNATDLLILLLRVHYTQYIEAELRKVWFEEQYYENQINTQYCLDLEHQDVEF